MVGSAAIVVINNCKQAAQECNQMFTQDTIIVFAILFVIFFIFGTIGYYIQKKSFEKFIEKRNERWNGSQSSTGNKE